MFIQHLKHNIQTGLEGGLIRNNLGIKLRGSSFDADAMYAWLKLY